jgi:cysteine desulfurase/selenocysteine lyase
MMTKPTELDVEAIREQFPIFQRMVRGKRLIYLDSAATSQKPQCVIDAEREFYERYNANVHRGAYRIAEEATAAYEAAREKIARFLNAPSKECIVFTRGTTEAINLVAYAWGWANLKEGRRNLADRDGAPQQHRPLATYRRTDGSENQSRPHHR